MVILPKGHKWPPSPLNNALGFCHSNAVPSGLLLPFQNWNKRGCGGDKPEPSSWPGSWLLSNVWFIAGRSLPSPAAGAQRRPLPLLLWALCCGCPHVPLWSLSPQGTVPIGSHPASFILSMFHQVLETVTHRRSQPKLMTPDFFFWSKFHKWFWSVEPLLLRTLKRSKVMERDDHSGVTKKPGHRVIEPHSSLDTRLEVYTHPQELAALIRLGLLRKIKAMFLKSRFKCKH